MVEKAFVLLRHMARMREFPGVTTFEKKKIVGKVLRNMNHIDQPKPVSS